MEKYISAKLGVLLAILASIGFLMQGKRKIFASFNVDTTHSILRTPLTLALLYGASNMSRLKTTRYILLSASAIYVVIGSAGLADRRVGGLLPSGLTNQDMAYHFGVGTLLLWMGSRPGRMMKKK